MRASFLLPVALVAALAACTRPMPGGDRDAHGCLPSGGYTWCPRTGQCERPWQLAERESLDLDATSFVAWCTEVAEAGMAD